MQESSSAPSHSSLDANSRSSVSRRFSLEGLNDGLHTPTTTHALTQQPGVQDVQIDLQHNCIHIHYDNTIIDVETVVEALRNAGCPPRQRFLDRLKYGWWRYLDENARGNATSTQAPCCSNPATIHAQRRRR
ncbi:MAG: heavy-metal-associated domain-containing protein [Candidatus Competibacteraceae bacterium]|nr:heavy-metal-associated domain-containing protein [Candidatus Competibacteraceae bacterium]